MMLIEDHKDTQTEDIIEDHTEKNNNQFIKTDKDYKKEL